MGVPIIRRRSGNESEFSLSFWLYSWMIARLSLRMDILVSSSAFWHARVILRFLKLGALSSFSARALLLPIRLISCSTTSVGEGSFFMSGYFSASFFFCLRGWRRSAKVCFWFLLGTLRLEKLAPLRSSPTERGILSNEQVGKNKEEKEKPQLQFKRIRKAFQKREKQSNAKSLR